jgi:hypothetical protein
MSEKRFDEDPEEPGDPLEKQEEDQSGEAPIAERPIGGEPWAKTPAGDDSD